MMKHQARWYQSGFYGRQHPHTLRTKKVVDHTVYLLCMAMVSLVTSKKGSTTVAMRFVGVTATGLLPFINSMHRIALSATLSPIPREKTRVSNRIAHYHHSYVLTHPLFSTRATSSLHPLRTYQRVAFETKRDRTDVLLQEDSLVFW